MLADKEDDNKFGIHIYLGRLATFYFSVTVERFSVLGYLNMIN